MNCSQCQGIESLFSEEFVAKELRRYRQRGPERTTSILIEALKEAGVRGLTLLDIGGGLGAIQHEMIAAGVETASDVEASAAYLAAARDESQRRGFGDQVTYHHGNFVELAKQLSPADIVTLDRVICCYPEMDKMVGLSASLAERFLGLVYPRDTWWMKIVTTIENSIFRLQHNPYRAYLHATKAVQAVIADHGFKPRFLRRTLVWQVVLFTR